jgi:hypothetical protein
MRKGTLRSGVCSSISEDPKAAHSGSNRNLDVDVDVDLSIDQPPPYKMASNINDEAHTPLLRMQPQPAEGQAAAQPLQDPELLIYNLTFTLSRFYVVFLTAAIFLFSVILTILFICFWKFKVP